MYDSSKYVKTCMLKLAGWVLSYVNNSVINVDVKHQIATTIMYFRYYMLS
jgi:hypothetical protein